jgi:hypothetical protein
VNPNCLSSALRYAELGYPVLPIAPNSKVPAVEGGLLSASTDPAVIRGWFEGNTALNVAIRTDGLLVVDIDGADNPWPADPAQRIELHETSVSQTPKGGFHHIYRQPEGSSFRNTASKIAKRVDTRADGGYIVAAPSIIDGRPYGWLRALAEREKLPEPPQWVLDLLAAETPAIAPSSPDAAITEGGRHDAMVRAAGSLRNAGLRGPQLLDTLSAINDSRCRPPLPSDELSRIAGDITAKPGSLDGEQPIIDAILEPRREIAKSGIPLPLPASEAIALYPEMRAPLIDGLLRSGETMNIVAASKTGKSWLAMDLALSVASGSPWVGRKTATGEVLIVDNELHIETISHRLPKILAARNLSAATLPRVHLLSLRGRLKPLDALYGYFRELAKSRRYSLVVMDALYRFYPAGTNENDNGSVCDLYNLIDRIADEMDAAVALVHHASKGNQAEKDVTDVGAGAGAQSRAPDTHLVMRHHETPGVVVVDARCRSFPPVEPFCLQWDMPVWSVVSADPSALKRLTPKREAKAKEEKKKSKLTPEEFAETFVRPSFAPVEEIRLAAVNAGVSRSLFYDLMSSAVARKLAYRWLQGTQEGYATSEPPPDAHPDRKRITIKALLAAGKNAAEVAETLGVTKQYVHQVRYE